MQVRDLNFFVARHGEDEGLLRYQEMIHKRIETWNSRSPQEQEVVNKSRGKTYAQMVSKHGVDAANEIMRKRSQSAPISRESMDFFIQLDNSLPLQISEKSVTGYKGREQWVKYSNGLFFVDYIVENCIIEYYGSYWHADPTMFSGDDWHSAKQSTARDIWETDRERIDILSALGYNVLLVWSSKVKADLLFEINKCKDFLNEHLQDSNPKIIRDS
jgi:very-short-patch-repair endonuclease